MAHIDRTADGYALPEIEALAELYREYAAADADMAPAWIAQADRIQAEADEFRELLELRDTLRAIFAEVA